MDIVGAQSQIEDFDEAGSQDPLDLLGHDFPSQAPSSPAPTARLGLFISPSRHDNCPTATPSEQEDSLQNSGPSDKRAITESPRPRTTPSQHRDSSPLSPAPLAAPAQPVPPSPPPPPAPPPPTLQEIVRASGWSLRPRTAQQIQPYKHDMALYRRQVSRHQDAYVASSVGIDHRRTRHDSQYEEDDTQEQEELARERRRRRLKSKSKTRSRSRSVHDDHLPSLPSSDSDSNDAGKEARAAARREKRRLIAAERERKEVEAAKKRATREEAAQRRPRSPMRGRLKTPSEPGPSRHRSPDPPAPNSQQSSQATLYRRRNIVFSSPIGSEDDEPSQRSTPFGGRFSTSPHPDATDVNADGHISPPGSPPPDVFLGLDFADDAEPAPPPPLTSQVPSENESEREDPEPESDQGEAADEDAAMRERLKILGKMYPAFMLPSLRAKEAQKRKQKEREEKRRQRAKERRRSKSPAFVVPDAPVEDYGPPPAAFDGADGLFDFDFDVQAESTAKGESRAADDLLIDISDNDSEDEDEGGPEIINIISDLEGSSDDEEPARVVRIGREPDLIDYMLVRNTGGIGAGRRGSRRSNLGGKKEIRGLGFPRSGGSGRHIVTGRDKHQSKQMRLTAHGGVAWTSARRPSRSSREVEVDSDDNDSDAGVDAKHQMIPPPKRSAAAQARKEKMKRRKEIQARNGVYTVQSSTPRFLLHANAFYTRGADLELEDTVPLPAKPLFSFNPPPIASRRAKAASASRTKPRGQPARSALSRIKSKSSAHHAHLDGHDTGARSRSLPVALPNDTDVDNESSSGVVEDNGEDRSITFSESTFIGKGYLFELVKCRDETAELSPHAEASAGDVTFSTTMSANDFLDCLSRFMLSLHEELFGHADIDAPMEDAAVRMGRVAAVTVSHLLRVADDEHRDLLKEGVQKVVRELLAKGMDGLETKRGKEPLGCMLWLPIELCFRVGMELPTSCEKEDGNELGQACGRLVHWLLGQWSTSKTQKAIRHPFHPIELWICLFHILRPQDDNTTEHPLWHLVRRYLDVVGPGDMTHIEMSDHIWSLVFQLSDLSLFNVHGRPPIHRTRTPTAWAMAEAALGCISLEASPPYPASYDWTLARVVRFCFRLYNKYGWTLVSAKEVLNQLSKIFRARHYARFDHEDHHFPAFIRDCDWASIGVVRKDDSAYVVYLKLLYLACSVLPGRVVTKLLSQSVPVMPVRFENAANQRGGSPSQSDMSILTHRYVSAAMAVKMQPSQAAVRVKQACQYTNFKDANHAMRMPIIMGFNAMCQVLLHCSLPLDAKLFDWLKDMVEAVLKDYVPTKEGTDPKQNPTLMDVWMLMRGVMYVLEAYAKVNAAKESFRDCLYPDPELLSSKRL
ncbi:hypothetical protein CYLTODRAFT_235401 [Cylindrobasidium torrendii FP15055 ss-10]|uniref:Uncharacterized protein n=1 Tax=Cylindrobasidium torrendii FP15055 ss-10 TaxID=1314674 RepID=A0A0D7BHV9_9AGAR|nr:hypothetical protein CYLTODRAFT_235401 [Cylindrobasidium torrendii FP15055 ss-10]